MSTQGPDIEAIFNGALALDGDAARRAYLDAACAGHDGLRTRVDALLKAHEQAAEGFLSLTGAMVTPPVPDAAPVGDGPGARVGQYKLLQLIGEGGFGSVFMAEQEHPVRRRVALKIIKLGMDTKQVIARFEAERQALAMMDHPNIAKVFEAGATSKGRPYFVMELVGGEAITDYCDRNNLSIADRLELFTQVCRAVQHAHTKGLIHRDLKPGNVLVSTQDGRALAKVIDFGIAKATSHRLTEKTLFTEHRALIGTPEYMSPEQAEGSPDIDTRTDVYSLGVLLYELLTGTTPFDARSLRSAAFGEIQRIIREVEPPKPSTRLSQNTDTAVSVAARRRSEPGRLGVLLRGELDWIVMKAMEKDRARRYETAGALAMDIQRHLEGEAVVAAPPSAAYRVRKFVGKYRGPVAAVCLIALATVLGLAGTLTGMLRAGKERDRAVESERLAQERLVETEKARAESERLGVLANQRAQEAEKARVRADRMNAIATAVTEFFTLDLMDLSPTPDGTREPTVRDVLERAPGKIEKFFSKEPAVAGVIRERIGQIYLNLGDVKKAEGFLEPAVPLLEEGLGAENAQTMMARQRLAELFYETGRLERAEVLFGELHEVRMRVLGPDNNFTWNSLMRRGMARAHQGKSQQAIEDAEKAFGEINARRGESSRVSLIFSVQMIECYRVAGKLEESEALARKKLELIRANPTELAPAEPSYRFELGKTLLRMERADEALVELEGALGSYEISYPSGHPQLVAIQAVLGEALAKTGRIDEARPRLEAAYAAYEKTYGAGASLTREVASLLAEVCEAESDADAVKAWRARATLSTESLKR